MWFKNLLIYTLNTWEETPESLEEKLMEQQLQPCGGLQMMSTGWVSPKGAGEPLVHAQGSHWMIALGMEKKLLPTTVINQFTRAKAAEIEDREGYKPGRKQMKEIKEQVTDDLLPRAFVIQSTIRAWIDNRNKLLIIDAGSPTKADELTGLLVKTLPGTGITPLKTKIPASTAMTTWLAEEDNPPQFTIDQDCELKSRGEQSSAVRYVRHSLEQEEIRKHIKDGKDVTRLGLTWADRISFVLQENLQIKRVAPLDVLKDQGDSFQDDAFDGDFTLMTGELSKLIESLTDSLGGRLQSVTPLQQSESKLVA